MPDTPKSPADDVCYATWKATPIGLYSWMSWEAGWRAAMAEVRIYVTPSGTVVVGDKAPWDHSREGF